MSHTDTRERICEQFRLNNMQFDCHETAQLMRFRQYQQRESVSSIKSKRVFLLPSADPPSATDKKMPRSQGSIRFRQNVPSTRGTSCQYDFNSQKQLLSQTTNDNSLAQFAAHK